jgi:hypothetical protein
MYCGRHSKMFHFACRLLAICLSYFSTSKMEVACSPEISMNFYCTIWHCISEDSTFQLKSLFSRKSLFSEGVCSGESRNQLGCRWKYTILTTNFRNFGLNLCFAETRTFEEIGLHSETYLSYPPWQNVHSGGYWIGHQQIDGWSLQVSVISVFTTD